MLQASEQLEALLVDLRYTTTLYGEQSVMTHLVLQMLMWHADNWGTLVPQAMGMLELWGKPTSLITHMEMLEC